MHPLLFGRVRFHSIYMLYLFRMAVLSEELFLGIRNNGGIVGTVQYVLYTAHRVEQHSKRTYTIHTAKIGPYDKLCRVLILPYIQYNH